MATAIAKRVSIDERGFTLIEILIAVVILALAVSTVTGLQSASLSGTRQIEHRLRALLIARQLFSTFESVEPDIQELTFEGTPNQAMQRLTQLQAPPGGISDYDTLYGVTLSLAPWGIDGLPEGTVWRLLIQVRWSDHPRDVLEAVYFVTSGDEE